MLGCGAPQAPLTSSTTQLGVPPPAPAGPCGGRRGAPIGPLCGAAGADCTVERDTLLPYATLYDRRLAQAVLDPGSGSLVLLTSGSLYERSYDEVTGPTWGGLASSEQPVFGAELGLLGLGFGLDGTPELVTVRDEYNPDGTLALNHLAYRRLVDGAWTPPFDLVDALRPDPGAYAIDAAGCRYVTGDGGGALVRWDGAAHETTLGESMDQAELALGLDGEPLVARISAGDVRFSDGLRSEETVVSALQQPDLYNDTVELPVVRLGAVRDEAGSSTPVMLIGVRDSVLLATHQQGGWALRELDHRIPAPPECTAAPDGTTYCVERRSAGAPMAILNDASGDARFVFSFSVIERRFLLDCNGVVATDGRGECELQRTRVAQRISIASVAGGRVHTQQLPLPADVPIAGGRGAVDEDGRIHLGLLVGNLADLVTTPHELVLR